MTERNNIEKVCSFYISNWHFAVMLLPCINNEIEQKKKIITFLQYNIKENVKVLLTKLNLKEERLKEIKKIKWANSNVLEYEQIENKIGKKTKEITILVSGKTDYIEKVNKYIEEYAQKNRDKKIKIINFYEIEKNGKDVSKIIDSYDKILNTKGEKRLTK